MPPIEWNRRYSVGMKVLDEQHIELFESVNRLHQAMLSGQEPSVTGPLIAKLMETTQMHFRTEEDILATLGFPGLNAHRERHLELMRRAQGYCKRYRCGETPVIPHFLNFLRDWFAHHIETMDKEYVSWLKEHSSA